MLNNHYYVHLNRWKEKSVNSHAVVVKPVQMTEKQYQKKLINESTREKLFAEEVGILQSDAAWWTKAARKVCEEARTRIANLDTAELATF